MKFDSITVSVWLAAFVPLVGVILAVHWDRWQRKRTTNHRKPKNSYDRQVYTLSLTLEKAFDSIMDCLLAATVLSAFFRC